MKTNIHKEIPLAAKNVFDRSGELTDEIRALHSAMYEKKRERSDLIFKFFNNNLGPVFKKLKYVVNDSIGAFVSSNRPSDDDKCGATYDDYDSLLSLNCVLPISMIDFKHPLESGSYEDISLDYISENKDSTYTFYFSCNRGKSGDHYLHDAKRVYLRLPKKAIFDTENFYKEERAKRVMILLEERKELNKKRNAAKIKREKEKAAKEEKDRELYEALKKKFEAAKTETT